MGIGIYIASEYKGLLVSIGKLLEQRDMVWYLCRDRDVVHHVMRMRPECFDKNVIDIALHNPDGDKFLGDKSVMKAALDAEKTYGRTLASVIATDRGLGQGYLTNTPNHPRVKKGLWPHRKKQFAILRNLEMYERSLSNLGVDTIISAGRPIELEMAAKRLGIKLLTLTDSRHGNYMRWSDDEYEGSEELSIAVTHHLDHYDPDWGFDLLEYTRHAEAMSKTQPFSFRKSVSRAFQTIASDLYRSATGKRDSDSYGMFGWVPPLLKAPWNAKWVAKHGVAPSDLDEYNVLYFPLHFEPEASLLRLAPEFHNSMEIVCQLSKSMSAKMVLVVKENPWCYGVRGRKYYDALLRMANVYLSKPNVPSRDWIAKSIGVVTITGTVGFEAIDMLRPVISFGQHQIINRLPSVNNKLPTHDDLVRSKQALFKAVMDVSFELPTYATLYGIDSWCMDDAEICVNHLRLA